jgi:hypothetical protein
MAMRDEGPEQRGTRYSRSEWNEQMERRAGERSLRNAPESRHIMFLGLAALLAVLWVVLFFAVHVTSFAIHILIILAVISLIGHFLGGRRTAV